MADFDDRTGLSSATPSRTLNEPIPRSTGYTPASRLQKIDQYLDSQGTASLESFPIDLPKYYFKIGIGAYSRTSDVDVADVKGNGGIVLPMPARLQDALGVNWEQQPLNWLGASLLSSAIPGQEEKARQQTAQAAGAGVLSGTIGSIGNVIGGLTGKNPVNDAVNAGKSLWGIAPNQFLTILLKGPQYKKYTFTWKLAPKNEKESQILYNIIRRLNNETSPSPDYANFIWRYPSIFQCSFSPNENQMYKFKPAVLENVVVDYTGSGMPAFYKSGYPESIQLSLSFLEMEFWIKGDFT